MPMTPPPNAHTLNACLARVIGKKVFISTIGGHWTGLCVDGWDGDPEAWDPVHDANQLEEVEAWVINKKRRGSVLHLFSHYDARTKKWECEIYFRIKGSLIQKENGNISSAFRGYDPDKKRAFALAVWEMEQAQKEE